MIYYLQEMMMEGLWVKEITRDEVYDANVSKHVIVILKITASEPPYSRRQKKVPTAAAYKRTFRML
jgi:hypothetical protein